MGVPNGTFCCKCRQWRRQPVCVRFFCSCALGYSSSPRQYCSIISRSSSMPWPDSDEVTMTFLAGTLSWRLIAAVCFAC